MPSDSHSYHLRTQTDGTIKGEYSYFYERYSMFSSDEDGFKSEDVTFKDKEDFDTWLQNRKEKPHMYQRADIYLDGIQIKE
jgi:hypothetical protein